MYPQHPQPTPGEVRERGGGSGWVWAHPLPCHPTDLGQGLLARAGPPLCSSKILRAEPGLRAEMLPPCSPEEPSVLIRKVGMRILSQVLSREGVTRRAARGGSSPAQAPALPQPACLHGSSCQAPSSAALDLPSPPTPPSVSVLSSRSAWFPRGSLPVPTFRPPRSKLPDLSSRPLPPLPFLLPSSTLPSRSRSCPLPAPFLLPSSASSPPLRSGPAVPSRIRPCKYLPKVR